MRHGSQMSKLRRAVLRGGRAFFYTTAHPRDSFASTVFSFVSSLPPPSLPFFLPSLLAPARVFLRWPGWVRPKPSPSDAVTTNGRPRRRPRRARSFARSFVRPRWPTPVTTTPRDSLAPRSWARATTSVVRSINVTRRRRRGRRHNSSADGKPRRRCQPRVEDEDGAARRERGNTGAAADTGTSRARRRDAVIAS